MREVDKEMKNKEKENRKRIEEKRPEKIVLDTHENDVKAKELNTGKLYFYYDVNCIRIEWNAKF